MVLTGRRGEFLNRVRQETGAIVEVATENDPGSLNRTVTVKGASPEVVGKALNMIRHAVDRPDNARRYGNDFAGSPTSAKQSSTVDLQKHIAELVIRIFSWRNSVEWRSILVGLA